MCAGLGDSQRLGGAPSTCYTGKVDTWGLDSALPSALRTIASLEPGHYGGEGGQNFWSVRYRFLEILSVVPLLSPRPSFLRKSRL